MTERYEHISLEEFRAKVQTWVGKDRSPATQKWPAWKVTPVEVLALFGLVDQLNDERVELTAIVRQIARPMTRHWHLGKGGWPCAVCIAREALAALNEVSKGE